MNFARSTWVKQLEVDIAVPGAQLWDFYVSQMTYIVLGGALYSLTLSAVCTEWAAV